MSLLDYEERTSEAVRDYLGNVLPDSNIRKLAQNGDDRDLLLLTMPKLVAGFGFTSRDLSRTYATSMRRSSKSTQSTGTNGMSWT